MKYLNRLFILVFILILFSCDSKSKNTEALNNKKDLKIAVAANIKFAMLDLIDEFEKKYPDINVKMISSSSGNLTAQINNGAPFDLFFSANLKYPKMLLEKSLALGEVKVYAIGSIVLWTCIDGLEIDNIENVLKSEKVKKIAIANPRNAPYGIASETALKRLNLLELVKSKIVYGETVNQSSNYIHQKVVDLGFTAKSVVLTEKLKNTGKWVDIPKKYYDPIKQGVVLLKYAKENNPKISQNFLDFIYSDTSKKIFKKYGYEQN